MANWIDSVVAATAEAESPERFQYWVSIAAIAAVMKKNVYLDRYYYKLYPNVYVFLVAKSGLRKSNPVTLAKKLVQETGSTRVIAGRNSIQGVLKDLGKAHSTQSGDVVKNASGFMVSGELASFLIKDPEALTILTDLYDTFANEPEWKNTTKTQGIDVLKEPCITLLGATNEEHFQDAVPPNAIGGGFMARTLVVFETIRRSINDLLDAPKIVPVVSELSCYLKELTKMTGEFTMTQGGKDEYRPWYHDISTTPHQDKTGTIERLGDTVLKVAMILSLADGMSLEISKDHVAEAIFRCEECLNGLKQITMGAGKSDLAMATALVLKELLKRLDHKISRKILLSKYWGEFDSITLDRIMETLINSGAVTADLLNKDVTYTMKPAAVLAYTKFRQEIN